MVSMFTSDMSSMFKYETKDGFGYILCRITPTVLGTKPGLFKGHSASLLNTDRILITKRGSEMNDCAWFLEVWLNLGLYNIYFLKKLFSFNSFVCFGRWTHHLLENRRRYLVQR